VIRLLARRQSTFLPRGDGHDQTYGKRHPVPVRRSRRGAGGCGRTRRRTVPRRYRSAAGCDRWPGTGSAVGYSIKYTASGRRRFLLRLGRYRGLRGPGYFAVVRSRTGWPTRSTSGSGPLPSARIMPDPRHRARERGRYLVLDRARRRTGRAGGCRLRRGVVLSAQTALRDAIGKHDLAELISPEWSWTRFKLALEQKMANWGIQVQSVRDPRRHHSGCTRGCHVAGRHRPNGNARRVIILGTAETEIAHKFVTRRDAYRGSPCSHEPARAMNMLYESIVKRGLAHGGAVRVGRLVLNVPSLMGVMGATGLVRDGEAKSRVLEGESATVAPGAPPPNAARKPERRTSRSFLGVRTATGSHSRGRQRRSGGSCASSARHRTPARAD
jgi:hypothetical protein